MVIDVPLIVYWLILFTLTTLPSANVPKVGIYDKVEHFLAFFILGSLLYLKFRTQEKFHLGRKYPEVVTIVTTAIYAAFDEIHQYFIPGRYMDYYDWRADMIGCATAVILLSLVFKVEAFIKVNKSVKHER